MAPAMERGIRIGGVDEDVRVRDEHYRPSMAWYSASRSATSTRWPPLRNVGSGGRSPRLRWARNIRRSADSTSSDIVRPCRAASRLRRAITESSMFSVVFIWKNISQRWRYVKYHTTTPPDKSRRSIGFRVEEGRPGYLSACSAQAGRMTASWIIESSKKALRPWAVYCSIRTMASRM